MLSDLGEAASGAISIVAIEVSKGRLRVGIFVLRWRWKVVAAVAAARTWAARTAAALDIRTRGWRVQVRRVRVRVRIVKPELHKRMLRKVVIWNGRPWRGEEEAAGNLEQRDAYANRGLAELVEAPILSLAILAVFATLIGLILVPPRAGSSRASLLD